MPIRRACDRCHRFKEKCHYEENEKKCTLCKRSALACTTLRLHLRQGRPPKVKPLGPKTHVQIWEIEHRSSTDMSQLTGSHVQQFYDMVSKICGSNNLFIYQVPTPEGDKSVVLRSPFDDIPGVIDIFYTTYESFMFGPTFAPSLRAALMYSYSCSPVLLHDILTVIFNAMMWAKGSINPWDQDEIAMGTTAMQKLRTARIGRIQDAFAIATMGQALAAFDLLTACVGSISILRYSLSLIRPFYRELSRIPLFDTVTITPILWDTVSCLVKGEIPVIKFFSRDPNVVDRLAGLCTTLLPIFYDLCVASKTIKSQQRSGVQIDLKAIKRIEDMLLAWQPNISPIIISEFSDQEIIRMKAQAQMYRTAGLLIVHRILNPIGTLDDVASLHAESIMLEYSKYSALIGPDKKLPNIAFPILLASLEISVPKETWENITLLTVAPACVTKIMTFVEYVWMERGCGSTSYVSDLVEKGPEFVVVP